MAFFTQASNPSLYLADNGSSDAGAVAFVLGYNVSPPGTDIELSDALTDADLAGNFIFSPSALDFEGDADAQKQFVQSVQDFVARQPAHRGFLWIAEPGNFSSKTIVPFLGLAGDGSSVASGMANADILPSLSLYIQNGMKVGLSSTTLTLSKGGVEFSGASAPDMTSAQTATLPFSGAGRGCVLFSSYIQRGSLYEEWNWGFHFIYPNEGSPNGLISEWLPLATGDVGTTDMIGFAISIDPANPLNMLPTLNNSNPNRSGLEFTGRNQDQSVTTLASFYRTVSGDPVTLTPIGTGASGGTEAAGLSFAVGQRISSTQEDFHAAPFGDFLIDAKFGPNGTTTELLCGLSGSEFLSVVPGTSVASASRLRFISQQGAYTNDFPPPVASPTGPPSDGSGLLTDDYVTSWATVLPPSGKQNSYAAQPDGASLFGYDDYVWKKNNSLLGHVDPGYVLPDAGTKPFPFVPYAGFMPQDGVVGFNQDQSRKFETLIIGPTRRMAIGDASQEQVLSTRHHTAHGSAAKSTAMLTGDGDSVNFTTPSGLIATLDKTGGAWQKILLGQITSPIASEMAFNQPSAALQQAFQTNQLFMVAANNKNFGGTFDNDLNIGGWSIKANVGTSPGYADYANIMIVKGIEGPLYDPDGDPAKNLVASPDKWTQADTFASPTTGDSDTPDHSQMVNLSQWLQTYFEEALDQKESGFFDTFNAIAKDPYWTGILVLRAEIAEPPADLAGITAGIRDADRFYAHHLAIDISQIKSDPQGGGINIDKQSSVYGLIYYVDSAYDILQAGSPVAPEYGKPYDFITLTLKVLFENTAVKEFSSFTQLTLNQIFGSAVTAMGDGGNRYNSIIMSGTFQNNNGRPTYGMSTLNDYSFLFNNNVLGSVETISAEMTTIRTDATETLVRFGLTGFIEFLELSGTSGDAIDLFSFGPSGEDYAPHTGLSYNSLGLNMGFATSDPVATRTIAFDSSQISFNMSATTARAGSLYDSLSLELDGLVSSDSDSVTPGSLGYLDVVTNVRMSLQSDSWNALKFKLNLGTAGELAGKVGLNAYLLLAWAPDSIGENYNALTAVRMPGTSNGASLISLQNVLAMSYGTIQLLYVDPGSTERVVLHPTTLEPASYYMNGNGHAGQQMLAPVKNSGQSTGESAGEGTGESNGKQFMFVLNEIAIKFLGMLKIPPSGSTAFYLFGDASKQAGGSDDNTGLAWYAAYNNEPKKQTDSNIKSLENGSAGNE